MRRAAVAHPLGVGAGEQQLARGAGQHVASAAPKIRGRSAAVPPWAPKPGARSGPLIAKSSPVSPMVAPTTAPKEPSGWAPALSARSWSRTRPATVRSPGQARAAPRAPPCWRCSASTNSAGVVLAGGVDERLQRAEAEERADRDRVGGERAGRVEVGVGVGLAGGADVAALDVEQHQRAELAGGGDDPLEDGDAPAAEPLVERRLRLDHGDLGRQRLDGAEREPLEPGDRVVEAPLVRAGRRAGRCRRTAARARGLRRAPANQMNGRTVIALLGGRAIILAAVVGSCRSAVPTWTARAPASRKARASSADPTPPAPTTSASGRSATTSATQRSASGRMAGPLSPPAPAVGHPGGQRVADHDGGGAGVERGAGALDDAHQVGAQLGEHRHVARQLAAYGGHRAGRVERLADVEDTRAAGVGGRDVDLDGRDAGRAAHADGRARRSRPASCPPTLTTTRTPWSTSQGSSSARNASMPGFWNPIALTRPLGVSTIRRPGLPGRASR